MATVCGLETQVGERLLARNQLVGEFFLARGVPPG